MKHLFDIIGDTIGIIFGGWSIFMFILIIQYGTAKFVEPNAWILWTEFALAVLFVLFIVWRLIDDILSWR